MLNFLTIGVLVDSESQSFNVLPSSGLVFWVEFRLVKSWQRFSDSLIRSETFCTF